LIAIGEGNLVEAIAVHDIAIALDDDGPDIQPEAGDQGGERLSLVEDAFFAIHFHTHCTAPVRRRMPVPAAGREYTSSGYSVWKREGGGNTMTPSSGLGSRYMKRVGMLSKILMGALLVEGAVYLGVGAALRHFFAWPDWALALGFLVVACLIRWKTTADMFRASERNRMKRTPEQEVDGRGMRRLLVAEYLCVLRIFLWLHPFEWLHTRRNAPREAAGLPILCIHGYVCNGGYWVTLRRFLRAAGFNRTYTINMDPTFGSIEDFAAQVARRVDEILAETGQEKVVLIGHSMGGLVSRCYVQRYGGAGKVRKIITLGTPHLGTYSAKKGVGEDARQMVPGNPWITGLNSETMAPVPITSIYSYHDNIIFPQDYSVLDGAKNIGLPGIGHLELAFSRPIQELVLAELQGLSS